MKVSIEIRSKSSQEWLSAVMNDFDSFLQDHADCERKASAMALSFIAKYPMRTEIVPELIETALEELEHFQQVYDVMRARGVELASEIEKDVYINKLIALSTSGGEKRFMDRLLLASVIECRGTERFKMVSEAVEDTELKKFYKMLWTVEAKHGNIFVAMALRYFDEKEVYDRLDYFMEEEVKILASLKPRAAVH